MALAPRPGRARAALPPWPPARSCGGGSDGGRAVAAETDAARPFVSRRPGSTRAVGSGAAWVRGSPRPAAITVTRTSSPSASSMTAPKMKLASGAAELETS